MYQKHHRSDELFTSISFTFALLLLTLFLLYEKIINNLTSDIDFWLYIAVSGLLFIGFVYTIVFFVLNYNYKRVDIALDFDRKLIILRNGNKVVPFEELTLFGYNKKKKDVKLLIKGKLYGFLLDSLENNSGEVITEEKILELSTYTKTVKHQHLYNYTLLLTILMCASLYLFAYVNDDFRILDRSIKTLHLFVASIVVYLIVDQSNRFRYRQLLKDKEITDSISNIKKSDTN